MILLKRRNPCIRVGQTAALVSSSTATWDSALTANDLIIWLHRHGSATPAGAPTGLNQIDTDATASNSGDIAWGIAAGGETSHTATGAATNNRSCAMAYRGCRIAQAVNASSKGNATSGTVTFPTLTLKDPGRSWAVGLAVNYTSGTPSATTAPNWRFGSGVAGFLNFVDSADPVQAWSGITLTLGASSVWAAWSLEIVSL